MAEKTLTPEDLAQFKLRLNAIQQANTQLVLLREGYNHWAEEIKRKYKLRTPFDVDLSTGKIVMKDQDTNGRPKRHR